MRTLTEIENVFGVRHESIVVGVAFALICSPCWRSRATKVAEAIERLGHEVIAS